MDKFNSDDVDNEAYLGGVESYYRNHADVTQEPFNDEETEMEKRQREFDKARAAGVGFLGYDPEVKAAESKEDESKEEDKPKSENPPESVNPKASQAAKTAKGDKSPL